MCLKEEDGEFKDEFHRFINSEDIKYIDDKKGDDDKNIDVAKCNFDGTRETSDVTKIGNVNPYLGMELGLNKGYEEGLHFSRVKNRAVDEDGKPIRKT